MSRLLWSAIVVCVAACSTGETGGRSDAPDQDVETAADAVPVELVRVLDGDSLLVTLDGTEANIRLWGVNAPEGDECLGDDARDGLRDLTSGDLSIVTVGRDQFDRTLAIAFQGSTNINVAMAERGLALALTGVGPDGWSSTEDSLIAAQDRAMAAQVGVWDPTVCGSDHSQPVTIDLVSPDPRGPDDDVLDQEYITLTNTGEQDVDMTGWILRDESTANRLPLSGVLPAGATIRVVTGCEPPEGGIGWCADRSVWNNSGDAAILLDEKGSIVAYRRYRP